MNRYWVKAKVSGLDKIQHSIFADSPQAAIAKFASKYPRREVTEVICTRADVVVTRSMRVPA